MEPPVPQRIILFDGVCNLCSGFMKFVYQRDKKGIFKFAWIQDESAAGLLRQQNQAGAINDTIVLIENGNIYEKSEAFLRIMRRLRFPWPLMTVTVLVPRVVRDQIYDWVARNRYHWFGRKPACMVPTGDLLKRFLSANDRD